MDRILFYRAGTTQAAMEAQKYLSAKGIPFSDCPDPDVTDLLLDIPSFSKNGILRNGDPFHDLISRFSPGIRIWGGRLPEAMKSGDLLENPQYVAENAAITADCAIRLCSLSLRSTWKDSKVLVIGWGRIGKYLCRMLKAMGAQVTVCARKAPDLALLSAFGYQVTVPEKLNGNGYQVIFNTAPAALMDETALGDCPIPMDLASQEGLTGCQVIKARGLPGIYAPITSGTLIGKTILKAIER